MSLVKCRCCNWVGDENELVTPPQILDDDLADYAGDCPECGANASVGDIEDYEPEILSETDRTEFLKNYGTYYAGLGGLFGTYRTAEDAFIEAVKFKPYQKLNFTASDFVAFEIGFKEFQTLRIAMQLRKAEAEEGNKQLLIKYGYEFQNYVYDKTQTAPEITHCKKCNKLLPCGCKGDTKGVKSVDN